MKKSEIIKLRVSPEMRRAYEDLAEREGEKFSEYVRQILEKVLFGEVFYHEELEGQAPPKSVYDYVLKAAGTEYLERAKGLNRQGGLNDGNSGQ